ncbi:MAG: phosphotransferase system IIB component, partial [Lysobacterales bacterium]
STSTSSFDNLDIKDSNNVTGTDLSCLTANGCVDSGNNLNWKFVIGPLKGAVIMISKYIAPIFPIKQLFMHM